MVLGTITKKSIGPMPMPIPIPPKTGKYWPIPQYWYRSNPTFMHCMLLCTVYTCSFFTSLTCLFHKITATEWSWSA